MGKFACLGPVVLDLPVKTAQVGPKATAAEWVDWFDNQRLHSATDGIPPHKYETNHYAQHQLPRAAGVKV